jgi:hypothetical protein
LFEDRNIRVGVFPEREEILVGGERPSAGGIGIRALRSSRLQSVGTCHSQMCQGSRPAVHDDPAVVDDLLKLGGGSTSLSKTQLLNAVVGRPRILLLKTHGAHQSEETGLGTQGVQLRIILDHGHEHAAIREPFFQGREGFLFPAQTNIDRR